MTAARAVEGFLSALSQSERADLLARGRQRRYPRHASVFCQGDSSDFVIVVLEGREHGDGPAEVRLSQQEIGELIGLSRESVSRGLAVLRDRRLARTGRRSVAILDVGALRSFTAEI